ncbi:LLM class flavin-dependent oxidoreductase [Arcanobacterium haemolyticum]
MTHNIGAPPTTLLGYIAAATKKIILSTSTTLIATNDPVKIAEDYAMLQHLADGRMDVIMRRFMGTARRWKSFRRRLH